MVSLSYLVGMDRPSYQVVVDVLLARFSLFLVALKRGCRRLRGSCWQRPINFMPFGRFDAQV